ncbi:MAG TPA: hypothetical protein VJN64_07195 [Terriglobales bacterium]|nr:hypothetical protein [Terriglobales bacterium]
MAAQPLSPTLFTRCEGSHEDGQAAITESYCNHCLRLVAASRNPLVLLIAERAHKCGQPVIVGHA